MISPVTVTINKSSTQQSGLLLYKDDEGRIIINNILSNSVFSNTNLKQSMQILSVNGISCSPYINDGITDDFVTSLIDNTGGQVTVIAKEVVYQAVVVGDGADYNMNGNSSTAPFVPVVPTPSAPPAVTVPSATLSAPGLNPPATAPSYNHDVPTTTTSSMTHRPQHQQQQQITYSSSSNPPNGCRDGGRWAKIRYSGERTMVLCCILCCFTHVFSLFGTCAFLCPQDTKNVYIVDNKVYSNTGGYLGMASTFRFI